MYQQALYDDLEVAYQVFRVEIRTARTIALASLVLRTHWLPGGSESHHVAIVAVLLQVRHPWRGVHGGSGHDDAGERGGGKWVSGYKNMEIVHRAHKSDPGVQIRAAPNNHKQLL